MPFQPGHTLSVGNKTPRLFTDAIIRALRQNPVKLKEAIEATLDKASKGDLACLDWLTCRVEGKAIQHSEVQVTKTEIREYSLTELAEIIATPILEHQDSEQPLTQDSGQSLTVDVPRETGVGESTPVAIEGGGVLVGD